MDAPQHKRRLRKKLEKVLGALEQQSSHEAQLQGFVRDARSREQVLEKQHSSLHTDYVALAARVQAQQEQLQAAQDVAAQLRLEREALQLQLVTAQQAAARQVKDQDVAAAAHQREVQVLRGDRDAAVAAQQATLTSLCRAEEQVSSMAAQLRQRDQECTQLHQTSSSQAAVATATGEAAAAAEEQLLCLSQELGEARQQLAEQQLRHQEDVSDMQALQVAAAEAVDLRHRLAEATSAAAALAAVRQQQEGALAKAAGQVAAAEEAAGQLRSLVDALTAGDQDVVRQQLLDASSRLQRSAPLLAAREAALSITQQQLEAARGEVVAAQAAAEAARQRCEVLRGLNVRLQASVVQQEALLEACLPPGKRASLPGATSPQWLALSHLQQQAAQLQSLTSQLLAAQPQHPGLKHTTDGMAATLQHAASNLEQHIGCLLGPAGPSSAPAAAAYIEALERNLEERCSEVEQLARMVTEAQQQLQGHVGRWSQLLSALGDAHGSVAAAASCYRAQGAAPGTPGSAQRTPWWQEEEGGRGEEEEGEEQLLALPGSLGSSLVRSSGALSLVLQELGETPAGCLAGDESWLQLEAGIRDQLGRLQLLLRSGAASPTAPRRGGGEEGAGVGVQLTALELALEQQEKAVRGYVAKLSAAASQLSSCTSTSKQAAGVLGACRPTTQQLRDTLSSGRSPLSTWRSSMADGMALGATTDYGMSPSTMWPGSMAGMGTFTSTTTASAATGASSSSAAALELVGELRLEVLTLQALLARKEEEVEGLAARQRRLLSGTEELVPVATLQHCQRQLKQAQQDAASAAQQLVRVRGAALGALEAYVTRAQQRQQVAGARLALWRWRHAAASAQARQLAQELLDTQGCLAASWQRHLGRSAAALSLLGRVAARGEAGQARCVLLAWQRRVVQQAATVHSWGQLAGAALAAQPTTAQKPCCIAARLAQRHRQDAEWASAARVCRLPAAMFTAWRAATRISKGQAELDQASAQVEALSAALPAWVAHLGDARRLERSWLAWRLAAAAATAHAALQHSRRSSRTHQEQGQAHGAVAPGVDGCGEGVGVDALDSVSGGAAVGSQAPGVAAARKASAPQQQQQQQQQQQNVVGAGGKWSLWRPSRSQTAAAVATGDGQYGEPSNASPGLPSTLSLLGTSDPALVPAGELPTSSSPRVTAQLAGNLAAISSSLAALQQQVAARNQYVCRSLGGTLGRTQPQQLVEEQQERPPWVDVGVVEVDLVAEGQLQGGEGETLPVEASEGRVAQGSAVWYAESPRLHATAAAAAAAAMTEGQDVGPGGGPVLPPTSAATTTAGVAVAAGNPETLCADSSSGGEKGAAGNTGATGPAPRSGSTGGGITARKGVTQPGRQPAAAGKAKGLQSKEPSRSLAGQSSHQQVAGANRATAGGSKGGPGRSGSAAAKVMPKAPVAAAAAGKSPAVQAAAAAAGSLVKGRTAGPHQQQQGAEGHTGLQTAAAAAAATGPLRGSGQVADLELAVSFPLQQPPGSPAHVEPPSRGMLAGSPGPTFLRPAAAGALGAAGSVLMAQRADSISSGGLGGGVSPGAKAGQLQGSVTASHPLARAGWQLLGQPVLVKVDASGGAGTSPATGLSSSNSWKWSGTLSSSLQLAAGVLQAGEPEVYIAQERPRSATPKPQAWAALPVPHVQQL